jgi:hypothetical protein
MQVCFFDGKTSYTDSGEYVYEDPVYKTGWGREMSKAAFLPFKGVMGQYSSIPGRFARDVECSKGSL